MIITSFDRPGLSSTAAVSLRMRSTRFLSRSLPQDFFCKHSSVYEFSGLTGDLPRGSPAREFFSGFGAEEPRGGCILFLFSLFRPSFFFSCTETRRAGFLHSPPSGLKILLFFLFYVNEAATVVLGWKYSRSWNCSLLHIPLVNSCFLNLLNGSERTIQGFIDTYVCIISTRIHVCT